MTALPDGISSSIRRLPDMNGRPFKVARSQGAWLYDTDGRAYVDHAMAMGATILGHAHPTVVEACSQALVDGPMPGFSHEQESLAAEALVQSSSGAMQRATFVTTGSEAVHLACRIARKATGRSVVAKIAGGFDGWYDDLALGWSGSPEARFSTTRPTSHNMTLVRYNDIGDLEKLFNERQDIAAVLIEPMLANAGSLRADETYHSDLLKLTHECGAFLICDEVLMGLRLRAGPSCYELGLQPDLITMGKAIGSGLPVAAVLGTADAFAAIEDGRAVRAGTYHGNPLVTAGVLATLHTLRQCDYAALHERGGRLRAMIERVFGEAGISVSTSGFGTVFSLWFNGRPPRLYDEAAEWIKPELMLKLHFLLRRHGVITMPGPWGRLFLSFAHGDNEFIQVENAYSAAAKEMARMLENSR